MRRKKMKQKESDNKGTQAILWVTYIFVGLFLCLIGNFFYFLLVQRENIVQNSYNHRAELFARTVIRGRILDRNNHVLAETKTEKDGTEKRIYPYGSLFAHVVGHFDKGKTGLEMSQDFQLYGTHGNSWEQFYRELSGKKNEGDCVITTLDVSLQKIASNALGNRRGAVVVMEPGTGKILAMVSKPSYDPNAIEKNWGFLQKDIKKQAILLNRATQGLYPPGSTFKILTALEYQKEYPKEVEKATFSCSGQTVLHGVKIHCYRHKQHGTQTLMEAFANSCNVTFATIGAKLNPASFRTLCEQFFFNQPLPIAFAYRQSSFTLGKHTKIEELPQTAIGQGKTLLSPLQNALIVATIANGGRLMKPYLVDRIETAQGTLVKKYVPQTERKILSTAQAKWITTLMEAVVKQGTARALASQKQSVAGKTGSAEYNEKGDSHAWFVGFAPTDQPKIVVSVLVEGAGSGSAAAVPIAKQIFDASISLK